MCGFSVSQHKLPSQQHCEVRTQITSVLLIRKRILCKVTHFIGSGADFWIHAFCLQRQSLAFIQARGSRDITNLEPLVRVGEQLSFSGLSPGKLEFLGCLCSLKTLSASTKSIHFLSAPCHYLVSLPTREDFPSSSRVGTWRSSPTSD